MGVHHGKRKRAHDSTFLAVDGEFKTTNMGTGGHGDFDICGKCGGTHWFAFHMFKCYEFGQKGHVVHDCKKDRTYFQCHQPGHLKPDYPAWVAEGV